MEPNLPVLAKKFWSVVRVFFYMVRKGISKRKLMLDLNMMLKRGKIAGKALQNLMFHHAHHWASSSSTATGIHRNGNLFFTGPSAQEYEFSCSNSPAFTSHNIGFPFTAKRKHNSHHHLHFFSCAHPPPLEEDDTDIATVSAAVKALEMLNSEAASPALPGFGRTPMVRQLRITDSPFPLRDFEEDSQVDDAAEEFIARFYSQLRLQNATATPLSRQ